MFFIFGISSGTKQLDFQQTMICNRCGKYGRLNAFMIYSSFTLFFIPIFRFKKEYFIRTSCCNTTYPLEKELGRKIEHGEPITLSDENLNFSLASTPPAIHLCPNCGENLDSSFTYCPRCGTKQQ